MKITQVETDLLKVSVPSDNDAEKALIASILYDDSILVKIIDLMTPDHFYFALHSLIYQKMVSLFNKGIPIDLITLHQSIKGDQLFDKFGGISYLEDLNSSFPTMSSIDYYIQILEEKYSYRLLLKATEQINQLVFKEEKNENILEIAESKIFSVLQRDKIKGLKHIKEAVSESIEIIGDAYENKGQHIGIQSGFRDLDSLTGGFQNSDLIIIAARPSMGKTALALNILEHVSLKLKKTVAFFSLEMSQIQIVYRLVSSFTRMNSDKIRKGDFSPDEFLKITNTLSELENAPIFIDDSSFLNDIEIRGKVRRLMLRQKVDLLIIDYLQLISSYEKKNYENRQVEMSRISRALKGIAREFNVPTIALSQLSRMVEVRGGDFRPRLSDLRDSGAIEQDADIVLFIYRDEYYNPDNVESQGKAEILLAKHRNGPTSNFFLTFEKKYTRFSNYVSQKEIGYI